jgi:hypothetical protein
MNSLRRHLKALGSLLLLLALTATALPISGCEDEGPAEEMGEDIDEAAEEAGDKIDEAADEVEESTD